MKKGENKMISSGEAMNKSGDVLNKGLICVRECMCPGFGEFKPGDKITDPATVEALQGSPYFKPIKEGK